MTNQRNHKRLIITFTFSLFIILNSSILQATIPNDSIYSKAISEIKALKTDIQTKTMILLKIAQNADQAAFSVSSSTTPYLRIVSNECAFFENQFETNFPIYTPNINDEFQMLQEEDEWFQVKLNDGREAWISESCIQRFNKAKEGKSRSIS